ncbi:metallophosphoesterase [Vulcanococcus sp. Clear-D1]|uniref:metallophosphoesterase n=1 Tax=Vulcanococcus sp. Clear-D1 TaxID=2766970 RepID=UPI0019AC7E5E|nr:metallophosphoesterase [Vulcanococcus sp. Clear-D1]MBD1192900.1 metallophosphoesterase [Vulcanococcus sp. Clear-D1]
MSEERAVLRVLQLSDPHLLADPRGRCRGRVAMGALHHAWQQALAQLGQPPDLLLISGDLCQDESLGGYVRLRELLERWAVPTALLSGNHDHPGLLRAALGRWAWIAPAVVPLAGWQLLLLSSHRPGSVAGWLEPAQLAWLEHQLQAGQGPALVALHHPPVPIGSSELDRIGLQEPEGLLQSLLASPRVSGVVFGHVHQHWQGALERPSGAALPLWACPSTLAAFSAVQPCPLGKADWPGGRLLLLSADGTLTTQLLRWPSAQAA